MSTININILYIIKMDSVIAARPFNGLNVIGEFDAWLDNLQKGPEKRQALIIYIKITSWNNIGIEPKSVLGSKGTLDHMRMAVKLEMGMGGTQRRSKCTIIFAAAHISEGN